MHELFTLAARSRTLPTWARYLAASGLAAAALALQMQLRESLPPGQLLLFVPAVVLSAVFFGSEAGGWSAAFSAALAAYFLFKGDGFAVSDPTEAFALVLFIAVALSIVYVLQEFSGELERRAAQAAAANACATKTERLKGLYLQDMAHRTKHDLQFAASLLQMEARALDHETCRASLLSAASRVAVVARVYARIEHGGALTIEMAPLIDDLCADLRLALIGLRPIALRTEVADCALGVDEARAVALIVNEFLVDALENAFPEDRAGTVKVRLTREGDDLALTVADDGVGFASRDSRRADFGQKLARSLAQQLGGAVAIGPGKTGARCELRFPAPPA